MEVSETTAALINERAATRSAVKRIADLDILLQTERQQILRVRAKAAELGTEVTTLRQAQAKTQASVSKVSARVAARTARSATRETASMAGEAIPFWGIAIIVAGTTVELYDMCQTVLDMKELEALFDSTVDRNPNNIAVCGMEVPGKEEIWQTIFAAPGAAGINAPEKLPTLGELREADLLNRDWKALGRWISDGAAATTSRTLEGAGNTLDSLNQWWNE